MTALLSWLLSYFFEFNYFVKVLLSVTNRLTGTAFIEYAMHFFIKSAVIPRNSAVNFSFMVLAIVMQVT